MFMKRSSWRNSQFQARISSFPGASLLAQDGLPPNEKPYPSDTVIIDDHSREDRIKDTRIRLERDWSGILNTENQPKDPFNQWDSKFGLLSGTKTTNKARAMMLTDKVPPRRDLNVGTIHPLFLEALKTASDSLLMHESKTERGIQNTISYDIQSPVTYAVKNFATRERNTTTDSKKTAIKLDSVNSILGNLKEALDLHNFSKGRGERRELNKAQITNFSTKPSDEAKQISSNPSLRYNTRNGNSGEEDRILISFENRKRPFGERQDEKNKMTSIPSITETKIFEVSKSAKYEGVTLPFFKTYGNPGDPGKISDKSLSVLFYFASLI